MAIPVEQIEAAIKAKAGNVSDAAQSLGITRQGLQKRINGNARLKTVLRDTREALVDLAESKLRAAVRQGNMTAIIWTLKASPAAKERGWGEKHEVSGPNNGPIGVRSVQELSDDELARIAAEGRGGTAEA